MRLSPLIEDKIVEVYYGTTRLRLMVPELL